MHTEYIYLFIYHVCMHLVKCVCVCGFVYMQKEVAFMNIFKKKSKIICLKKTLPQQKPGWYQFTQLKYI